MAKLRNLMKLNRTYSTSREGFGQCRETLMKLWVGLFVREAGFESSPASDGLHKYTLFIGKDEQPSITCSNVR